MALAFVDVGVGFADGAAAVVAVGFLSIYGYLSDDLQTMACHLNLIARKYKMTISSTKTKSMTMWVNHTQSVKIVINDNIIEQVTDFTFFGYRISE